jgi:hypothetical protein
VPQLPETPSVGGRCSGILLDGGVDGGAVVVDPGAFIGGGGSQSGGHWYA